MSFKSDLLNLWEFNSTNRILFDETSLFSLFFEGQNSTNEHAKRCGKEVHILIVYDDSIYKYLKKNPACDSVQA